MIKPDWVKTSERLPTREDADLSGRVIVNTNNGYSTTVPFQRVRNMPNLWSHWLSIYNIKPPTGDTL